MDGSFFAFAVLGAALGWFVGDFQRHARYRRESRANLARSVARSNDRASQRAAALRNLGTVPGTDSHGNDDGAAFALKHARIGEARRRAIRGNNGWTRSNPAPAGRYLRSADETPVMAGRGWDFDGD